MLSAGYREFDLEFTKPVRTSRGGISRKHGYLLSVSNVQNPGVTGTGECSTLEGLSYDDKAEYEEVLASLCRNINQPIKKLMEQYREWPSICFGLETAMLDLKNGGTGLLFYTPFTKGREPIPINGLVWMGDYDFMLSQIDEKIAAGFKVIKLKIGAIDFESELNLLRHIRSRKDSSEITIRLDANGAFSCGEVVDKLYALAEFNIHSIEQPVKAGTIGLMKDICEMSPIPVALDEELIGHHSHQERSHLIQAIKPAYIILKPSLLGGFSACNDWIKVCNENEVGYWITSALESNVGLNAIAQYTSSIDTKGMPQGLGTGSLFRNNFPSQMEIVNGELWCRRKEHLTQEHLTPNHSPQGEGNSTLLSLRRGGQGGEVLHFLDKWHNNSPFIEVKTSGSTGLPKVIKHSKEAMRKSAAMTCDFLGLKPGMTALICLSTQNIAGMMMVVRAIERELKVIEADGLNAGVKAGGNAASHPLRDVPPGTVIDFCAMVPAQVYNSLKVPEEKAKLELIRNLIVGGAPVSYGLQQMIRELPGNVYSTFGMTETMSHIALRKLNGDDASEDYTLLEGITVTTGEAGNLIINAPYLSDEPIITNDLAEITGSRTFKWLGRLDHVINSGGFKIIPENVEDRISAIMAECLGNAGNSSEGEESTQRYFITSLPDEKLGEIPVMVIELPDANATGADATKPNKTMPDKIKACIESGLPAILSRHEMPREFFFTDKFIETPTHKIIRSATMKRIIG